MTDERGRDTQRSVAHGDARVGPFLGTLVVASLVTVLTAAYGISGSLLSLKAMAVQAALVALGSLLILHGRRIRRLGGDAAVPTESTSPRWGDVPDEPESWDLEQLRTRHYLLAVIAGGVIFLTAVYFVWPSGAQARVSLSFTYAVALAVACLIASCVWLVFARWLDTLGQAGNAEATTLASAARESQWFGILSAGAILLSVLWQPTQAWVGRGLLVWVLAAAGEQVVRTVWVWVRSESHTGFVTLPQLLIREPLLGHPNPIASLLHSVETRFGVDFRSSWSIRFVMRMALPMLLLLALVGWGLSCIAVVQVDHFGIRESFGRVTAAPVPPGLRMKLPWPFGRVRQFPVKEVRTMPIGFVLDEGSGRRDLLWSKEHAREEFELVLGDGAELVAVDALVYYKIHEDRDRFLDYAFHTQNPEKALEAYGYRALMEETRSATINEILSVNRAEFAHRLESSLREYSETNRLGLDVVEVALINLHPPVSVAPDYLDVISARIDAKRVAIEASGAHAERICAAETQCYAVVAEARQKGLERTGIAEEESWEFRAIGEAYDVAPEALKLRLWYETLEDALRDKRLVVVDKAFAGGPGEILLDLRPRRENVIPGGVR